jgi:hypothetical protein
MLGTFQAFFVWLFVRSNLPKIHTCVRTSQSLMSKYPKRATRIPKYRMDKSWKSNATVADGTRKRETNISAFPDDIKKANDLHGRSDAIQTWMMELNRQEAYNSVFLISGLFFHSAAFPPSSLRDSGTDGAPLTSARSIKPSSSIHSAANAAMRTPQSSTVFMSR